MDIIADYDFIIKNMFAKLPKKVLIRDSKE